jgi:hypothetical protein
LATRKEIEDQIAALQAEADEMGEEDEFDVEIWNEKGEGARLPHGQTTRWLKNKFPELFDPDEPDPDADNQDSDGKGNTPKSGTKPRGKVAPSGNQRTGTATRYFGKRPAGK